MEGIYTASCVGKVYSKVLRRSLVPFFEKYARADQHGGVKGRGTEIASLTARILMRRFSKIGKSLAVLFVDALSAFYSLLLEQVSGAADQESALNNVLDKLCYFPKWVGSSGETQRSRMQAWRITSFVCWSIGIIAAGFRWMVCECLRVVRKARGQVIRWQT